MDLVSKILPVSIIIFLKQRSASSVQLWCQKRETKGSLHGLWEFPGGKIETNESALKAALRELGEEVDPSLESLETLEHYKIHPYTYEGKNIVLYIYTCLVREPIKVLEEKGKWFTFDLDKTSDHLKNEIPPANHQIIDEFLAFLKEESYGIN